MHLHLNPIGGLAGDMFCAALLDARPDLLPLLQETLAALSPPAGLSIAMEEAPGPIAGKRFVVRLPDAQEAHGHARYSDIEKLLETASLSDGVRRRARTIFHLLAQAEGRVHGVDTDDVVFHEIGNWDSIVDIVSAAFLLEQLGVASASTDALPLGKGRVDTAHGQLPVPAPATALLLEGLPLVDDGIAGERITPTGAAILRFLDPEPALHSTRRLLRTGYGFGTRDLEGIPNCVQVLLQDDQVIQAGGYGAASDRVGELIFEVDDQSPEDLATGLDRLRALEGVLSVTSFQGIGKVGRPTMQIQLLAWLERLETVAQACFQETTTIGLRWRTTDRWMLRRDSVRVEVEGEEYEVKRVTRPDGTATVKTEHRSLQHVDTRAERQRRRRLAEQVALAQNGSPGEAGPFGKSTSGNDEDVG